MNINRIILNLTVLTVGIPVIVWTILLNTISLDLPNSLTNSSISLLIAHPDDEAMFFGPTLARITSPEFNNNVSIICFSSGNFDGIGATRKRELKASAALFNVPWSRVKIIDDARFPDSQKVHWDASLLASEITGLLSPSTKILTFDNGGVSDHANHKAVFEASVLEKKATGRELFVLKSVPTWRKYIFVIDALFSLASPYLNPEEPKSILILSTRDDVAVTQSAMISAHQSQMKWFRYGWIYLSRYMVANDLVQL